MKKTILFILFLIFAIFIFNKFYISGFTTFKVGENEDVDGRTVTIKQISSGSVVVDVNGVSNIVDIGQRKEINGIEVTVDEIFYVEEKEGRFVKLNLKSLYKFVCGDGDCEGDETKESCCKDCGCDSGYVCEDNKCILESKSSEYNECGENEDCDDEDDSTIDRCKGSPKTCVHILSYLCERDEDCDDGNGCTEDKCINYDCLNKRIAGCEIEVEEIKEESPTMVQKEEIEKEKGFLSRLFSILFGWLG